MRTRKNVNLLIFICLLVGAALPLILAYISYHTVNKITELSYEIDKNDKSITLLKDVNYFVISAEAQQRGYCISGGKTYLDELERSKIECLVNIEKLKDKLANEQFIGLQNSVVQKVKFIDSVITIYDKYGTQASQAEIAKGKGKELTESIISKIERIKNDFIKSNQNSQIKLDELRSKDELFDYLGTGAAILVFLLTLFIIFKNSNDRNEYEQELLDSKEKLIASEKRFMDLFYNNPANNILLDFETNEIIDINQSYLDLVGYRKQEVVGGITLRDSLKITAEEAESLYNLLIKDGYFKDIEMKISTKQNEIKTILVSGMLLKGLNEKRFSLYYLKDITDTKKYTEEITKAKLEAENSAKVKGQFLANMSHEIRTPLNAIIGFTNLLFKSQLDNKQDGYLKAVKTSSTNLLNITNDILDYSKLEAGMFKIEEVNFDLKSLINSVFTMFIDKAESKNIKYTNSVDNTIPQYLLGDPTRLTQILINVLSNAFKFTEKGIIDLSVKQINAIANQIIIEFTIQDSGIGIKKENIEKIFERFNQGEDNVARQYGGTGLGLAIVKRLVELQKGKLKIESEEGKGTIFKFEVPYTIPLNTEELALFNTPVVSNLNVKGKRILVVEDNNLNQLLAEELLTSYGFEVIVADNGQIAVEILNNQTFDLILMDLQMPVLDGYQTTEHIRKGMNLTLPIIAMSAHALVAEKEKCISLKMNDFITKPFKEEDLKSILSKYFTSTNNNIVNQSNNITSGKEFVIDLSSVIKMSKGKDVFVKNMVQLYLTDMPIEMSNLQQAISKRDYTTIQSVSHKINSSLGIIGMCQQGIDFMQEIESDAISKNNVEKIKKSYENFDKLFLRSVAELENYVKKNWHKEE